MYLPTCTPAREVPRKVHTRGSWVERLPSSSTEGGACAPVADDDALEERTRDVRIWRYIHDTFIQLPTYYLGTSRGR